MTEELKNHLAALTELRNLAIKKGLYGAALSAEIARGKVAGIYATAIQINTPPLTLREMTTAQILEMINKQETIDPQQAMATYVAMMKA